MLYDIMYIYIYIHTHLHMYIYIYMYYIYTHIRGICRGVVQPEAGDADPSATRAEMCDSTVSRMFGSPQRSERAQA